MQEFSVPDEFSDVTHIIGIDECGCGAIAGPLTVCVVVLERDVRLLVKDSKRYASHEKRKEASNLVKGEASFFSIVHTGPRQIEELGQGVVLQKSYLGLASEALSLFPNSLVIIDGQDPIKGLQHPQISVIGGDKKVCAVSAASVVGKVARDEIMMSYASQYEDYFFNVHKGYPTPQHLQLLQQLGVTDLHRTTIQRVADALSTKGWYTGNKNG